MTGAHSRPVRCPQALTDWLTQGEVGLSSKAIASRFLYGSGPDRHPWDPADFRRCELLLRRVPEIRAWFPAMADASPTWKALVEHWAEIAAVCETEVPGIFTKRWVSGLAPQAYAVMRRLREGAGA